LNWQIGKHIHQTLANADETYGLEIVATLSPLLMNEFGKGYTISSLHRIHRFYNSFSNQKIVATLSPQLSWSHFIELTNVKEPLSRMYYTELCKIENWNVRELRDKINSMLFERTALSKKPEKLIKQELQLLKKEKKFTEDIVFRDKYLLDFLDLKDVYSERDLEAAILAELQSFISEIGSDFAFLSRQKRIQIDSEDYYIDLLFYHRGLNRLVVIELKLGKFKPQYKSQMELYLKWLEKYEMRKTENPPIGLLLCTENGNDKIIELMLEGNNRIKIAHYLTKLPELKAIEIKLAKAVKAAHKRLQQLN
jgi:predicted nuclease of restriction endonuclease-like (RecB) superfamily